MSSNRRIRELFRDERWLIIPGVILAIILAIIARGRMTQRAELPEEEPTVSVYMHDTGQVRNMALESYLQGVVAAEMDPDWPLPALEAQAIVARTFTLRKMQEGGVPARGTNASTDPKEFQAYSAAKVNDRVKQAVADTRGQVLLYGGNLINAWFHASSGGITAGAAEGLGYKKESTPYVIPVNDVKAEPAHPWSRTFSNSEVSRATESTGVSVGRVTSVSIGRKGPSGRAETLIVNGKEVSAPAFRIAIGDRLMKSTLLDTVRMDGDSLFMKGRGYGHGVGMSQWGAWMMAQRGKSATDILNYYYRGIKVETLWK